MKRGLWGLLLVLLTGCQTYAPRMSIMTKADTWQENATAIKRSKFQPNEDMVIAIIGGYGRPANVVVTRQDNHQVVYNRSVMLTTNKPPMPVVETKLVTVGPDADNRYYTYVIHPKIHHSTSYTHCSLNLSDPGRYEAQLTVDGKLVQKASFQVVPNSAP